MNFVRVCAVSDAEIAAVTRNEKTAGSVSMCMYDSCCALTPWCKHQTHFALYWPLLQIPVEVIDVSCRFNYGGWKRQCEAVEGLSSSSMVCAASATERAGEGGTQKLTA